MGKKKKIVSTRGFATSSIPSKDQILREENKIREQEEKEKKDEEGKKAEGEHPSKEVHRRGIGDVCEEKAPSSSVEEADALGITEEKIRLEAELTYNGKVGYISQKLESDPLGPAPPKSRGVRIHQELEDKLQERLQQEGYVWPLEWRCDPFPSEKNLLNIYSSLERLHFPADWIEKGIEATLGWDERAAVEWILLSAPAEDLPQACVGLGRPWTVKTDEIEEELSVEIHEVEEQDQTRTATKKSPVMDAGSYNQILGLDSDNSDSESIHDTSKTKSLIEEASASPPPAPRTEEEVYGMSSRDALFPLAYPEGKRCSRYREESPTSRMRRLKEVQGNFEKEVKALPSGKKATKEAKLLLEGLKVFMKSIKGVDMRRLHQKPQAEKPKEPPQEVDAPRLNVEEEEETLDFDLFEDSSDVLAAEGATPKPELFEFDPSPLAKVELLKKLLEGECLSLVRLSTTCARPYAASARVSCQGFTPVSPPLLSRDERGARQLAIVHALWKWVGGKKPGLKNQLPPLLKEKWIFFQEEEKKAAIQEMEKKLRRKFEFVSRMKQGGLDRFKKEEENIASSVMQNRKGVHSPAFPVEALKIWKSRKKWREEGTLAEVRAGLPVAAFKEEFLDLVEKDQVTIIKGETGSGKTTQLPQFLVENGLEEGKKHLKVLVLEPRRVAAVSVAKRVSEEMGDEGGPGREQSLVGFSIRNERQVGACCLLEFCTVGVALKRLQSDEGYCSGLTHIVVDEVHERGIETDVVLLVLRRLLASQRFPDLRVVLMSATADTGGLLRYFSSFSSSILQIPGRTFPVEELFLEDAVEAAGYTCDVGSEYNTGMNIVTRKLELGQKEAVYWQEEDVEEGSPADHKFRASLMRKGYSSRTVEALQWMDLSVGNINYELMNELLKVIVKRKKLEEDSKKTSVLIFLPGMAEIRRAEREILEFFGEGEVWVVQLHSGLGSEQMQDAFRSPKGGKVKVVLSTNIAETGVTIPDVDTVVDFCLVRVQSWHEQSQTSSLDTRFVSKAEAKQRRGRAGRVRPGRCFHMVTSPQYDSFRSSPTPELLRSSLTSIVLSLASQGIPPSALRDEALDPPPPSHLSAALCTLQDIKAISPLDVPLDLSLPLRVTALGRLLGSLPCDVRVGRVVLLARELDCLPQVALIAAALGQKSPFLNPPGEEDLARAVHRQRFLLRQRSDHLALLRLAAEYSKAGRGWGWCKANYVSKSNLDSLISNAEDLLRHLCPRGTNFRAELESALQSPLPPASLVGGVLLGGLYPNLAWYVPGVKGDGKIFSDKTEALKIHPSSLLHKSWREQAEFSWLTFYCKLATSSKFIVEVSEVSGEAVALFGGWEGTHIKAQAIGLTPHASVEVNPKSIAVFRQLRERLEQSMAARILKGVSNSGIENEWLKEGIKEILGKR